MKLFVLFEFIFCVTVSVINCVLDPLEIEPLAILKDLSGGHNIVGKNIELECQTTFYGKYVSVEWDTPQHIKQNVTLEENTNSTYVTVSTLVIHEAQKQHSGFYTCKIIHKEWNHTVASRKMWVTVYGAENVLEIDDVKSQEDFFKKTNAEIEVEILAHPNISVVWYNPKQETINNSSKITIFLISVVNDQMYNYKAKLRFNNITKNDLGKYTLVIKNNVSMKTKKIFVNVNIEQQIALSLNIAEINEEEMIATYQCKAAGDPKPYIVWKFIPCVSLSCLDKTSQFIDKTRELTLEESDHEDRGLQITSYVVVNLTNFGILKCVTENSEAIEPINYFQNGFENYLTDKNNYTIKREKMDFGYGQFVAISCPRSQNKYTPHIIWYHNGKQINEKNSYYVDASDILLLDKFISMLLFQFVDENQIGTYSCQVLTKTGKTESKTVEVVSKHMPGIYPLISVKDLNGGHTKAGQNIRLLCNVTFHKHVEINWFFLPSNEKNRQLIQIKTLQTVSKFIDKNKISIRNSFFTDSNGFITISNLTVTHASESGYYSCEVNRKEIIKIYGYYVWVQVNDINKTSLIFNEEPRFNVQYMNIKISMTAHPQLVIKWYDNHGKEISASSETSNYFVYFQRVLESTKTDSNYKVTLKFKSIDVKNFGNYTIVAENGCNKTIKHSIQVNVTGVPETKISIYEKFTSNATLKCTSTANPKPTIKWYFKKCTTLTCMETDNVTFESQNEYVYKAELRNESQDLSHISYISVNLSQRGILICRGLNSFGENYTYQPILGSENDFEIFTKNKRNHPNGTVEFVGKNELKVACAVSKWNYTGEFAWSHNASQLQHFGAYNSKKKGKIDRKHFLFSSFSELTISVDSPSDIYYTCTTLNKTDMTLKSRTLHVKSRLSSYVTISNSSMTNKSLQVDVLSKLTFYCYAEGFPSPTVNWYKDGKEIVFSERYTFLNNRQVLVIDLIVPEDEGEYSCEASNNFNATARYCRLNNVVLQIRWEYIQVILVLCAILLVVVLQFIKVKQAKKEKKLNLYGIVFFQKGALENLNPALSIEDQAALLPFDRKWEIPLKKIEMGKQLGSGAFGVTYQATVINHFTDEPSKTVAIKTINPMSGYECVKALASEMKIMSHLGSHVNIVNFLGATTKYIVKNELYIVLEFCSFGNLLKYIQRYSLNFIDQKNYESDDFIWSSDDSELENFEKRKSVSSKDLAVWSFQIARGMEYLGHRRVVHGDLAARNVLLTEKNVIKLCDFGLAKNVYNYGNYVKKSEGPLPVKWMAIEAIEKGIFSTQSDIWSFGVVLWEIFSLGKTPFSGVTVDENFCKKLTDGYRMEKPESATTKIYNMMLSCWQIEPLSRPSFSDLVAEIGSLLGEPTKDYYVIMNNDYLLMNKERFDNSPDYLTMIPPPTYDNVVSNLS